LIGQSSNELIISAKKQTQGIFDLIKRIQFDIGIVLCVLFIYAIPAGCQNYCAVLDMVSNGTIPERNCILISDKISEIIVTKSNYLLFDRSTLPDLLKQFKVDETAANCTEFKCLTRIGSLIGANTIIGGSILYKNHLIEIRLYLVDVDEKQLLNTVSLSTTSKKTVFLNSEIPALMKNLLNPALRSSPKPPRPVAEKKSILSNPFLYVGTFFISGAAAGAYYYKNYYKKDDNSTEEEDPPLSMDDVPIRSRE
jgi:hypothetical protein